MDPNCMLCQINALEGDSPKILPAQEDLISTLVFAQVIEINAPLMAHIEVGGPEDTVICEEAHHVADEVIALIKSRANEAARKAGLA